MNNNLPFVSMGELRMLFTGNTKFYLQNGDDKFEISNKLFGTKAFSSIQVSFRDVSAAGKQCPINLYFIIRKCMRTANSA